MTLARLVVVVLLVGSIPAISQEQQSQSQSPQDNSRVAAKASTFAAGQLQPRSGADAESLLRDLGTRQRQIELGEHGSALLVDRSDGGQFLVIPMQSDDVELLGDEICYTIRSYVVARDTRDSDSTHPVKSSTCQMASRFRVKTVAPTDVAPAEKVER
jgi:hypothetical protein